MSQLALFTNGMEATATFSPCERYRYTLTRRWAEGSNLNFLMLNPSTATAEILDPTVTRCIGYARAWGHDAIVVTNLFAFRATDPRDMLAAHDPIGPENDAAIIEAARGADFVICAWGKHGRYWDRGKAVLAMLKDAGIKPYCLKRLGCGSPGHPLYLRADLRPLAMELP